MRNRTSAAGRWAVLAGIALASIAAAPAGALTTTLDTELDDGLMGSYATVEIVENAGSLDFTITLDSSLGSDADLHAFFFNIADADITGLAITTSDTPQTPYTLTSSPSVKGGAGSSFDYGVSFGNGAGPPGNGTLQTAQFTLSADQPLALVDLDELSSASGGTIDLHFVAHVQSTSLVRGSSSEAVGGTADLPEPSAGVLLGLALAGLSWRERRRALSL